MKGILNWFNYNLYWASIHLGRTSDIKTLPSGRSFDPLTSRYLLIGTVGTASESED